MDASQSPLSSSYQAPAASITVNGDLICIGNRRFQLKCGGAQVTDEENLQRVKSLIEKHFDVGQIHTTIEGMPQGSVAQIPALIRIRFTDEGAQVSRLAPPDPSAPHPQVVSCKGQTTLAHGKTLAEVQANYQKRLKKIQNEFTEVTNTALKLKTELEGKGYTPEEVREAIAAMFEEGHLFMTGEMPEWGEKTIADLLQEPGNEALFAALKKVRETYFHQPQRTKSFFGKNRYRKKCVKDIQMFILKNQKRNIKSVEQENNAETRQHFVTWKEPVSTLIQQGSINPADSLLTKRGLPSEADKGDYREEIVDYNTNLGVVGSIDDKGTLDHVIATRSGKSDTLSRLQEHVVTSLLHEVASTHPCGLQEANGTFTYQATITSYLDPSTLKAVPERMQALWKSPEDEQKYLLSIIQEADKWPPDGYKIQVTKADGTLMTVVLKKPIILNQLFSTTVRGVASERKRYMDMGQKRSDEINVVANQRLVQRYLIEKPLEDPQALKQKCQALDAVLTKALGGQTYLDKNGFIDWERIKLSDLIEHKEFFKSHEFQEYQLFFAQMLVTRIKTSTNPMLEKALFATLFRQFPPSQIDATFSIFPTMEKEMHAADFAIYKNILFHKLKIPAAYQCKSGTDRTGLGIAFACAQDAYRRKYGTDFDPELYDLDKEKLHFFKEEFRKALKELGIAITVETKGYFGIKWGGGVPLLGGKGNPVAYKYLYLEGDDPKKTDVSGLTAQDLKKRGIQQYRGALTDPEGIYKKSSKKFIKALQERQKQYSSQEREAAIEKVSEFFNSIGVEANAEDLFNEKMQPEVHVRRLHLMRKARSNEQETRLKLLSDKIEKLKTVPERTPQQNLELYMLQHVSMLWQTRQESKHAKLLETFAKSIQFIQTPSTTSSKDALSLEEV